MANYDGIDFDDINEATGLAADEIKCLKVDLMIFDIIVQDCNFKYLFAFRPALICLTQRKSISCLLMILVRSWEPWASDPLRRSWRNFFLRLTRMVLVRLSLPSSASSAPPSWLRIQIWRPWRENWRMPSGKQSLYLTHEKIMLL